MSFLLDTNVVSEIRKPNPNPGLWEWFDKVPSQQLFLSVLVLGEIRCGITRLEARDVQQALVFQTWLNQLTQNFQERILAVGPEVADCWGRLNYPNPVPVVDGLIAATAIVNGLTLVTRNVRDYYAPGLAVLNPFTVAFDPKKDA